MTLTTDQLARFWSLVDRKGEHECWPWKSKDSAHPRLKVNGQMLSALRIMYELYYGEEVPPRLNILRTCGADGHDCINPHHMVKAKKGFSLARWRKNEVAKAKGNPVRIAQVLGYELSPTDTGFLLTRGEHE